MLLWFCLRGHNRRPICRKLPDFQFRGSNFWGISDIHDCRQEIQVLSPDSKHLSDALPSRSEKRKNVFKVFREKSK